MAEQAKVPAIRFAGFTDPWEQRKLGELVTTTIGGGTPSTSNPAYWDGEIPWIQSSNVLEDTLFDVDIPKAITQKGLEESAAQIVPENSIAVVTHVGVGKLIYLPFQYSTSQDFISLCGLKGDARYTCYALWKRLQEDLHIVQGSAIKGITKEDLLEKNLPMPSVEEQAQIGVLFSQLDNLITLHQRKYDKLVIFKKSMLEKMFPKDGESVPEIRFAGFTDPWEQRKLSEVATFGGGHTPPMADPDNYEDGYVLWVTSQDVKSNYLDRTTTQITEKGAKELTLYPAGSLVMVTRSGILRHTLPVAELRKPSTVNQDIRVILPQGECCGEWLLQFFISHNKELLLEFGKTGTTVESVDFGKIKDMLLYMPSTVEQQQIGDFFAKLDSLITLHQRKLELLQNIKKSLLDKMFV